MTTDRPEPPFAQNGDRPHPRPFRGLDGEPPPIPSDPELTVEDELALLDDSDPQFASAIRRLGTVATPPGLVDRIYASSVAMLPMPARVVAGGDATRSERWWDGSGHGDHVPLRLVRRWAPRLAMAAAIGLALLLANPFTMLLNRGDRAESVAYLFTPALLADGGSAAEPMLVALLCDVGGGACWLEFEAEFGDGHDDRFVSAGDDMDSLLLTRGARFDDLAAELWRIVDDAPAESIFGGRR